MLSFPFFFTERVRIFEVIVNVNYVHSGVPLVDEARQLCLDISLVYHKKDFHHNG